jgi:hypothetical protein
MKHTGLDFYVEGQYVSQSDYVLILFDPVEQRWTPFDNADIHPFGKRFFTIWSQFTNLSEEDITRMAQEAATIIDWLRQERGWELFDATLWLYQGEDNRPKRMFRWDLC